ncbi:TRAP transporter small permease subunit [uncultured Helicobacter sp.]|uniref:TRAP transporter small permease subunit n=1 Tax=uncultured Helicobacter sp. TaxID=175537 RepID=UPI00262AD76B|nr:TRAP transporter small permease subunit [uncultured Helicobacter sp.]
MQKILKIAHILDSLSLWNSRVSMIALWALCLLTFGLSIALNFSYVNSKLDDFSLYCFALMVLLAFSWTLKEDKHVRVDLLYVHYSDKVKVVSFLCVNLFFILPFCLVMIKYGLDFTIQSFKIGESSQNGKIPYYFIFKSFVVFGFFLLSLQSLSEILKSFIKIKQQDYSTRIGFFTEETQTLKANLKAQKQES